MIGHSLIQQLHLYVFEIHSRFLYPLEALRHLLLLSAQENNNADVFFVIHYPYTFILRLE